MLDEFRDFIARGNVLDLAIAVIVGAAFGGIVTSLTDDIIMPIIGALTGGFDFSSYFVVLGEVPPRYAGSLSDYVGLKKAGAALLGYGAFGTTLINFVIVAAAIFILIKVANRAAGIKLGATPPTPPDVVVLLQIQTELQSIRQHLTDSNNKETTS
ncbi:large conductance mechanosensitive channel protein MscL [Erythrobacter donghaensis]|uniref:large conductance mechanosensitive channel protein MscL n=1 Tax=Erythrobacter donghaensis TaxID=267135 RepID=UPI000A39BDC7|nr:large conductance mechanosensitive channel protein MscL [Erythrobacter donghaensis]